MRERFWSFQGQGLKRNSCHLGLVAALEGRLACARGVDFKISMTMPQRGNSYRFVPPSLMVLFGHLAGGGNAYGGFTVRTLTLAVLTCIQ